ncbi:hypothetical protein D6C82_05022 [Aureobasidium pullulans]|nr:hypothetical protein D6C82_05022 [Aureobasidium pullulans]
MSMSGLEVAGLVLAVIPLFISAFEHYEAGLRPFQRFFNYEQEASRYKIILLTQYAVFSQTLDYLLTELTDQDELDDMVTRGYGDLWKDSQLNTKLQRQLGTAYESFRIVLVQISNDMEQLATILDIQRQGQLEALVTSHKPKQSLPRRSPQSFLHTYEFQKKLKFSHKGRRIQPLLEALMQHNRQLESFTEKSKKLAKARSKGSRKAFSTPLHHVQKGAERLYKVLSGTWTCSQHASHIVNLMLEPRVQIPHSNFQEPDSVDSVAFHLTIPNLMSPSVYRSIQVHVLHDDGTAAVVQSRVAFEASSQATPQIDVTKLPTVGCLCIAMEGSRSQKCAGFCVDHQERLLRDYPLSQELQDLYKHCSGSSTSLKDIISEPPTGTRRQKPFNNSQACLLGLTIASSFLQLRSTAWISGQWRSEDVYFVQRATSLDAADIERPFIRQTYLSPAVGPLQANPGGMGVTLTHMAVDDKYAFLKLGIMLLEIFAREPFPSSQSPAAGDHRMADLVTVNNWVEQEKGNMTKAFYNAISACISWFAHPGADLRNDDFKRDFIDQLIIPLRDESKIYVSATRTSGP